MRDYHLNAGQHRQQDKPQRTSAGHGSDQGAMTFKRIL